MDEIYTFLCLGETAYLFRLGSSQTCCYSSHGQTSRCPTPQWIARSGLASSAADPTGFD